ncbi:MAG: hypothetical protein RRY79_05865 [Clostridia bacterium]
MKNEPMNQDNLKTKYLLKLKESMTLSPRDCNAIILAFEKAFAYFDDIGITIKEAISRFGDDPLGDFYKTPDLNEWYQLDNAAKVYPLSMTYANIKLFRVSAYLKMPIIEPILQIALLVTMKRFPIFSSTLRKGVFWHYLDAIRVFFPVEPEQYMPCSSFDISSGYSPNFKIKYYGNRISLEAFHALSDGAGALVFLKTLIAEYLKLLGEDIKSDPEIFDVSGTPDASEFVNAFPSVDEALNKQTLAEKKALHLKGRVTQIKPAKLCHYIMSANELLNIARQHNTTLSVIMLSAILLSAKSAVTKKKGEIHVDVPVNMRKFYPSHSLLNFSMYGVLCFDVSEINDFNSLIPIVAKELKAKTSKEYMDSKISWINGIVNNPFVRKIPLSIKGFIFRTVYKILGEKSVTATFSNLGTVHCDFNDKVEMFDFILGPTTVNIAGCAMGSYNDKLVLTITKVTLNSKFENSMLKYLRDLGLDIEVKEVSI